MTTGLTYNQIIQFWADHIPLQTVLGTDGQTLQFVQPTTTTFDTSSRYNNDIPFVIAYAEGLMYRDPDLDFLATRQSDSSQTTTAGSRYVTIPPTFIVLERLNLILPAGQVPDSVGSSRVPLIRTSPDVLDTMWPATSTTATPSFGLTHWALFTMQEPSPNTSQVRIGPTPDGDYTAEFKGTFRPAPLQQQATAQTFLTEYLPDLFQVAGLISWSGLMKNYSAAGVPGAVDDPQQAVHWMQQYNLLKRGAAVEEARKKSLSSGFGTYSPTPVAAVAGR